MKNLAINPALLVSNETFTFQNVPSMYDGFTDVIFNGERIAIINGRTAPLQWTAKNGSNIPVQIIEQLENTVKQLLDETNKLNQSNSIETKIQDAISNVLTGNRAEIIETAKTFKIEVNTKDNTKTLKAKAIKALYVISEELEVVKNKYEEFLAVEEIGNTEQDLEMVGKYFESDEPVYHAWKGTPTTGISVVWGTITAINKNMVEVTNEKGKVVIISLEDARNGVKVQPMVDTEVVEYLAAVENPFIKDPKPAKAKAPVVDGKKVYKPSVKGQKDIILDLFTNGKTRTEIQKLTGCSSTFVYRVTKGEFTK